MVRNRLASLAMSLALATGSALGTEPVVELSEHSIHITQRVPDSGDRAWDQNLFREGQLYFDGYANPFKVRVRASEEMGSLDEADVKESDETDANDKREVGMMPSHRWRAYLNQHLISELVRPEERWQLMLYIMAGIVFLQMVAIGLMVHFNG